MATATKSECVLRVNGEADTQLVDSVFAMVGEGVVSAARQGSAKLVPPAELPVMIPRQPVHVHRRGCIPKQAHEERTTWRDRIGKVILLGGVLCIAYFFLKEMPGSPLCDQPARSGMVATRTLAGPRTKEIQNVEVGDRAAGRNPLREQVYSNAPEPEPGTWRKLVLRMKKASGRELRVNLLRPLAWIEETKAKAGSTFFLNLPEMGAVGDAHVDAIEPCPPIKRGHGNVVTGTFHHEADPDTKILQVEFSDGAILTGVTDNHPFWSEDRQDFVRVGELKKGDRVRVHDGIAAVTSVSCRLARPGEMLCNLEIQNEHVYQVGTTGILVHNSCAQTPGSYLAGKAPRQVTPGTSVLQGQYVDDLGRVQPWTAHYDEFGRMIGRTDFNAANRAAGIPDIHNHIWEYNFQYPLGRHVPGHFPGEYMP